MGEKREYRRRRRPSDEMEMELRQRQVRRRQTRAPYPEEQRRVVTSAYVDPKRAEKGRRMAKRRAEEKALFSKLDEVSKYNPRTV